MDGPVARRKKSPYRQRPVFVPLFLAAWKVLVGCLCICLFLVAGKVLVGSLCIPSGGPAIDPATLLIEETDFPPGWKVCESGRSRNPNETYGAEEVVYITFCFPESPAQSEEELRLHSGSRGGEDIYRYCNAGRAARGYDALAFFPREEEWWQVPEELQRMRITATRWRTGCTDQWFRGMMHCEFVGQYDEYVVLYTMTIPVDRPEWMPISEFASIGEKIDRKMTGRTSIETPIPGD